MPLLRSLTASLSPFLFLLFLSSVAEDAKTAATFRRADKLEVARRLSVPTIVETFALVRNVTREEMLTHVHELIENISLSLVKLFAIGG